MRLGRLASPAGLILAGLCLLLPFMSASCESPQPPRVQWQVTYTGADILTGGRPDVAFTDDADQEPVRQLDDEGVRQVLGGPPEALPPQPVAWVAAALMLAALAATALPSRAWRSTATGGLALAAAIVLYGAVLLARNDATDAVAAVILRSVSGTAEAPREWDGHGEVRDTFRYLYGFWLTLGLLAAVAVGAVVDALRAPAKRRPAGRRCWWRS